MGEAARRGLVVPSPEPLHDTDSDDIPQSAQKKKSHDSDSMRLEICDGALETRPYV